MTWRSIPQDSAQQEVASIDVSLQKLARRLGMPPAQTLNAIFSGWDKIVGPEIARQAKPRSMSDGVLVLVVNDARWATQIRWMAGDLVKKLNDACNSEQIQQINVRVETGRSTK